MHYDAMVSSLGRERDRLVMLTLEFGTQEYAAVCVGDRELADFGAVLVQEDIGI
ncbi:hypothetical protein [Rhizobium leguminosarum]|uniref:hypothetical protein n=1 Tax=Rhizobium leguminosarum TaxID=384 RepID=UPI0013D90A11|nr:hypothetical protein [Rhizobium leguminosarum]NEI03153.1 hypothetical protein [Rhizobium leguminosarum]NEJ82164.1 hypothetical protein [Rhizobium leguminosarum]